MVDLDDIKRRNSLLDILQRLGYTAPQQGNGRSDFTVNCPIPAHEDRTPSCRIHVDTGRFHCFGCGAHGDIFDLAQQVLGLRTLAEAIQWIDGRRFEHTARVRSTPTPDHPVSSTSRERILEMNARAWQVLTTDAHVAVARRYLMSRGIDVVSLDNLGEGRLVGYTPAARHGLTAELQADGCSDTELIDSGWSVATPAGPIDRFHRRVMFPIRDADGLLVGVTARDIAGNAHAKYINTPATPAYRKGDHVYAQLSLMGRVCWLCARDQSMRWR